jgi:hypothetical protein
MISASRCILLACAVACPALCAAPVDAQERGRVRIGDDLRPGMGFDARSLFSAPLPSGPAFSEGSGARAVSAYAPEQRIRLKQMNFTGVQ